MTRPAIGSWQERQQAAEAREAALDEIAAIEHAAGLPPTRHPKCAPPDHHWLDITQMGGPADHHVCTVCGREQWGPLP